MASTQGPDVKREPLTFAGTLTPEQEDALVQRVLERLQERRDEGFLDVRGAAEYLSTTPKAIYALVERQKLPHNRAGGRLLFDCRELRAWVERDR